MSYKNVGYMPDINYPRSIYAMPKTHKTSMLHGYIEPLHCFRVQPGDGISLRLSDIIRMSTPLVPFMDGVVFNVRAVFVPLRLLWNHWEEFIGANKGAGYQQNTYLFPADDGVNLNNFSSWADYANLSLSYKLGKNLHGINNVLTNTNVYGVPFSVLKERGYYFLWNKLFRSTQLQAEYSIDFGDGIVYDGHRRASILTSDNNTPVNITGHKLLKVNKMHDYFVDNCLSPQYGESVTIGLGDYAPVGILSDSSVSLSEDQQLTGSAAAGVSGNGTGNLFMSDDTDPGEFGKVDWREISAGTISSRKNQLVADLSQATATTVNQLRYAFATQRWLERANYGGNNYYAIIAVHYGIINPMATMQMPEYLGGLDWNINVNQVTQQTGFASGVTTELGEVGAVSVTARKDDFIFRKSFTEFGFVYILAYTKHFRSYGQGIPREDLLVDNKYQILWPEFMNIGDQKTLNAEIYAGSAYPTQGFGYQEAWAEYKFFHDTATGLLNPSLPSGALGQWTLTDAYATAPSLSSSWIQEDRNAISRVLKTGATGPDFICDFAFKYEVSRIINIKKLPGLIDHVGLL